MGGCVVDMGVQSSTLLNRVPTGDPEVAMEDIAESNEDSWLELPKYANTDSRGTVCSILQPQY